MQQYNDISDIRVKLKNKEIEQKYDRDQFVKGVKVGIPRAGNSLALLYGVIDGPKFIERNSQFSKVETKINNRLAELVNDPDTDITHAVRYITKSLAAPEYPAQPGYTNLTEKYKNALYKSLDNAERIQNETNNRKEVEKYIASELRKTVKEMTYVEFPRFSGHRGYAVVAG